MSLGYIHFSEGSQCEPTKVCMRVRVGISLCGLHQYVLEMRRSNRPQVQPTFATAGRC